MADLLGTVGKIVELAWSIKKAVETVRHNEEECRDIEKRVGRVSGIVTHLQEKVAETASNKATSGALEDLAEALDSALKLVTDCQRKSRVRRFVAPGGMAEKLRRAQTDISDATMTIVLALNVRGTIVWESGGVPRRPHPQDYYVVQSAALPIIEYEEEEDSVKDLITREMNKNARTPENGEILDAAGHVTTVFVDPSKVTDQVTEVPTQYEVTHVGNGSHSTSIHEISGSSETVTIEGEETGPKLTASIAGSKNISPNASCAPDISTGSMSTTEVNETKVEKDQNDKVIIEEYDLEKILDEQENHDLYCPNCKSCITRRVILKMRKRTARQAKRDEPPKRTQLAEPCASISVYAEGEPDVFGCLSCFAFFIPTDIQGNTTAACGGNLFFNQPFFNPELKIPSKVFQGVDNQTDEKPTPVIRQPGFKKFSLPELEDATHNFLEDNLIGRGAFAIVYKGVLSDGVVVAVKKIQYPYQLSMEHICDKITHVSKLEHNNIVQLLGYGHGVLESAERFQDIKVRDDKEDLFLVEEYLQNGTLYNIVYGSQLDWSCRFLLIQGIAHGLHYLHEQQFIHLDLKPNNVLIDSNMNPKITDFGRARLLDQGDDVIIRDTDYLLAGTMGYMPPEYIMEGIVSKMYDVYSFGVIILETISGMCRSEAAHRRASIEWAWAAREAGRMEELLDLSVCFETQLNEAKRCLEIGLLCTQSDRADRPTMVDVVEMLHSKKELPTPKQPQYTKGRDA